MTKPENTSSRSIDSRIRPGEVRTNISVLSAYEMFMVFFLGAFQCRQRGTTYAGPLKLKIEWTLDGVDKGTFERPAGEVPIMVKVGRPTFLASISCHTLEPFVV